MVLLNGWVLFGLLPLYFIYRRLQNPSRQTRALFGVVVLLFFAMARPALPNSFQKERFDTRDYIVALDVSYSMQATDIKPSRYLVAKEAIKKLLRSHPKDRFTLFAFTSKTLLISPPTTDTAISMLALDALNPEYILTKSTNLVNLFETVAQLPMKHKNLIIFSDGGDDHDIKKLATIATKNSITPYIVATATAKGAALKKNDRYIKDSNDAIVVSKINPMLPDLANATHGKYYKLTSSDMLDALSSDITTQETKKQQIQTKTYRELFYYPLGVAIVLFLLVVTKIARFLSPFLPLGLLLSNSADASVLDFYHLDQAQKNYKAHHYNQAAESFAQASPSVQSYYNIATSLYKAGRYRDALEVYSQIKTTDKKLKQRIYYNMANAAAKSQHFDKAIEFYINALILDPHDKDARYNLDLLRSMKLTKTPKDRADMMPRTHHKKEAKKTAKTKQSDQTSGGSSKKKSNPNSGEKSNGGGGNAQKKQRQNSITHPKNQPKGVYTFTYKAYEKINKGYTDEKEPW